MRARQQLLAGRDGALHAPAMVIAELSEPEVAAPAIGVHDRAVSRRGLHEAPERVAGGVGEDLQAHATRAAAADLDRDPDEHLFAVLAPAAQACFEAAMKNSSTST